MPSSLSLSSFGVIVAAVAIVAVVVIFIDVVLVAPATIALAAFIVALAVVTTTFLAIDVGLIFDCCVCRHLASLLPPSLPSPSSSPSSPSSSPSSLVADCYVVVIVPSHTFQLSYCSPNHRRCLLSCHIHQPPRPRRMHSPGWAPVVVWSFSSHSPTTKANATLLSSYLTISLARKDPQV